MKAKVDRWLLALGMQLLFLPAVLGQTKKADVQLRSNNIPEVIKAMTLEEKAMLVVGADPGFSRGYPSFFGGPDTLFGKVPSVVGNTKQIVAGSAGTTYPIPRLGIPAIVLADGPAGLRIAPTREGVSQTYYATAFPIATLLASSWDTSLVRKVGQAMGNETLHYGVDVLLAPALNIHRNPLGGRNFEYYSEDPIVTGFMTAAMVKGVQGNGVGTSIKHFAANNNETNRMTINTVVSERALREIYLKGFQIAVKQSRPWTVMSSYNKINGVYASEQPELLNTVLRKEWGFNGLVMSDWFAGRDQVRQLKAGNDLIMPGSTYIITEIVKAVKAGTLSQRDLDSNVAHILNVIVQTPKFKKYVHDDKPNLKQHAAVARAAATEGMVLLKNENNALPLAMGVKTVAAFGNASYQIITGGTGSGDVNKAYSVSMLEGLNNTGIKANEQLQGKYEAFLKHAKDTLRRPPSFMDRQPLVSEYNPDTTLIQQMAKTTDVAIVTLSRSSGEFHDRLLEGDFYLTSTEKSLIENVGNAFHAQGKKLLVLLNTGGVIEVASWRNHADAILLSWQPGQEGGNAIADLLRGKTNPSGKLAVTFPLDYKEVPSAKNFPGTPAENPTEVRYEEGIYVGYRYYNSFQVPTAYEFGYGLSYTSFAYSDVKLSTSVFKDNLVATVKITNTGKTAGKEIAQLYVSAPFSKIDKPKSELKGFAKTGLLQPGESQELQFTLTPSDLTSFDMSRSAWIADSGTYTVNFGTSSKDFRLSKTFELPKELVVEKVNKVLTLKTDLKEYSTVVSR
jgi:beta-glucosidase